jgi:uncharacterized membrane protein YfcA
MSEDELRYEIKFLRREIDQLERGRLQLDLEQLHQKGSHWYRSKGGVLYMGIALIMLLVGSFFNRDIDLGTTGQTVVLFIILACFFYYWESQKQDRADRNRQRELEERPNNFKARWSKTNF